MVYNLTKNMVKRIFVTCCVVCLSLSFSWCSFESNNTDNKAEDTIANEASVYCENHWWTLELVPDEWWVRWKCNFDDWSFCEEWAYYHWECSPGWWNGNTLKMDEIQNNDDINEEFINLVEELWEGDLLDTWDDTENNLQDTQTIANNCPKNEIKKCNDWTFLVREWPNCEFWSCPGYPLSDDFIQDLLHQYQNSGSELNENDIDLMNGIIDVMTQI